ncbi:hypothetical protein GOP47_0025940 [Adiantum capillus-veneris]|uniref:DNA primase large subunit n=1 Tax=Adiantum capillus-veneris TaxID=13818 RepID=A0A9D4Z4L7_ADICA|nr:hypothetical protein GOP47_0025940 [Adiantum capillus-veneris]
MDFRVASNKRLTSGGAEAHSRLSFYLTAPSLEVSLEEFEQFALDRLRVLKGLEEALSRGRRGEELEALVTSLWRKYMRTSGSSETSKDTISHFVLRLVYCRSDELRKWFLAMESSLFRHRFQSESFEDQKRFMEDNKIPYRAIGTSEFESVKDKLGQVARSLNQPVPNADSKFYKVPFEEVPELVSGRKVYIHKGLAFVPSTQLASLVVGQFRSKLSKALVLTNRKWMAMIAEEEADRLTPIVEALSSRYLGPDYSQAKVKTEVNLQDIDSLAKTSFPLCMRHLFFKLREEHHLKHGGRQQLGLFLKGVGLKLEDALAFWRSEFSQKVGVEKFDKEYAYNVRHNYGKEGKRTDYTPFSCNKVILSTPGVGDHHGCPYRHFSEDNLRVALGSLHLGGRALDDIMEKVRNRHYQLACSITFEATHGSSCAGINHPNQYFEESQKILQPKAPQASPNGVAEAPVTTS